MNPELLDAWDAAASNFLKGTLIFDFLEVKLLRNGVCPKVYNTSPVKEGYNLVSK